MAAAPALELPRVHPARMERKTCRSKESDYFIHANPLRPVRVVVLVIVVVVVGVVVLVAVAVDVVFLCRFRKSMNRIIAVLVHSVDKKSSKFPKTLCKTPASHVPTTHDVRQRSTMTPHVTRASHP